MRTWIRIAVGIFLLFGVVGLGIHYGTTYDAKWPHPTGDQLAADYDAYVDDEVLLIGEVTATTPAKETLTIEITDDADEVAATITVHNTTKPSAVKPGGTIQAYGTLQADKTMTPTSVAVVNRDPAEAQYKLAVSVVGILLAIGYFLSHWRPNVRRLTFEQRTVASTDENNNHD